MGLDAVELVMEVEDEFGVRFADEDFPEMRTVGDMERVVVGRLAAQHAVDNSGTCRCVSTFCRVRQTLMQLFDVPRNSIRVASQLEDLVPRINRRSEWVRLWQEFGQAPPELQFSARLQFALLAVTLAMAVSFVAVVLFWMMGTPNADIAANVIAASVGLMAVSMCVLLAFGKHFAIRVPEYCTVGDVVIRLTSPALHNDGASLGRWSRDDVWQRIQAIISEQLNIPLEEITREASFVDDLRVD